MIPNRAHIKGKKKTPGFSKNSAAGWLAAYISEHRASDAHTCSKGWPTPVALNLGDWVCAKPTGNPCMSQWFSL